MLLAKLARSGDLAVVRVLDGVDEAMHDLVRARMRCASIATDDTA